MKRFFFTLCLISIFQTFAFPAIVRYWFDFDFSTVITNTIDSDTTDISIDVSGLSERYHTITVQYSDNNGDWSAPHTSYFLNPPNSESFHLTASDIAGKCLSSVNLDSDQQNYSLDVRQFPSGYNPIFLSCSNKKGEVFCTRTSLFNQNPPGEKGIKSLGFYIDDDREHMRIHNYDPAEETLTFDSAIDVSEFTYEPKDTKLTIEGGKPHISPLADLHITVTEGSGHTVDSIVPFTDRFRQKSIDIPILEDDIQYDFEENFNHPAWLSFRADSLDAVNFRVRRDCDVTLLSPSATILEEIPLTVANDNKTFTLNSNGIHYLKLSHIKESAQIFSTKLKYTNRAMPDPDDSIRRQLPEFEGQLITWGNKSEWLYNDSCISFADGLLKLTADNADGNVNPRFNSTSDCLLFKGNRLKIESDKFITKIYFSPSFADLINNTTLSSSTGNVEIDSVYNVAIWTGFSSKIDFYPTGKSFEWEKDADLSKFFFRKLYVTLSDISSDTYFEYESLPDIFDGSAYTHMYVWHEDGRQDTHIMNEIRNINFTDNSFTLHKQDSDISYPKGSTYIITFEFKDDSSVGKIDQDISDNLIEIRNGSIYLNNLPNHVAVYDINGTEYFSSFIDNADFMLPIDNLGKGVFIIKVGNKSAKILL